jgi:hypothetical protein
VSRIPDRDFFNVLTPAWGRRNIRPCVTAGVGWARVGRIPRVTSRQLEKGNDVHVLDRTPTGQSTIVGRWFNRNEEKFTLSVQDYDIRDDRYPVPTGFGIRVTARRDDGADTELNLDFNDEHRQWFDRFRPEQNANVNRTLFNHSWRATCEQFVEACREAVFHVLEPGTKHTQIGSGGPPGSLLAWNDDSDSPSPITYTASLGYKRELAEVAEGLVLKALYVQPLSGLSFEALVEGTSVPSDLLPDVLALAGSGSLISKADDGTYRLTPSGKRLAEEHRSRPAKSARIGF